MSTHLELEQRIGGYEVHAANLEHLDAVYNVREEIDRLLDALNDLSRSG